MYQKLLNLKISVQPKYILSLFSGVLLGFLISALVIFDFSLRAITLDIYLWVIDLLNNQFLQNHSSYSFGVSISAIAVIVAFIQFMSGKNEFRFHIRAKLRKTALSLAVASLIFTFLGEIELANRPFLFEIIGALLMVSSIALYLYVITSPLRKISHKEISVLRDLILGAVSNSKANKLLLTNEVESIFDSLLGISTINKEAQRIFTEDFASNDLLKHFSESGYIFETTVTFLQQANDKRLYTEHIELFTTRLMINSLENEKSFLNMFISEKIYPDMRFSLDEVMLNCSNVNVISAIFGESMWNSFRQLSKKGQLQYISLMSRYFRTVYRENNHSSFGPEGYKRNREINVPLVLAFYSQIKHFFDINTPDDFQHKLVLLDNICRIGHSYLFGVRTGDKPEKLKIATGEFVYEILESFIAWNKIQEKQDYAIYFNLHHLHDEFLEAKYDSEDNTAYKEFTKRLKDKIIGSSVDDYQSKSWGANYQGYFPELILVYFYMFGFYLFSDTRNTQQDKDLHLPILTKLSESFPKLHQGFKQEFYDAKSLPLEKKQLLQRQGREILNKFLKKNMVYNFEDNSLSYYYSGNVHSSKIFLNDVKAKQIIKPIKL